MFLDLPAGAVKLLRRDPEAAGVSPHLVQRGQPEEGVERRVLQALRHDRPGELLEAQGELAFDVTRNGEGQKIAQEVEEVARQVAPPGLGAGDRFLYIEDVRLADL